MDSLALQNLILWQQHERPIDWRLQFGRDATLAVEIGFGSGEFLVRLAQAYPDFDFVGIERERRLIKKTLRKISRANVTNARLLQADAHVAFERLFPPQSLHRIYSLFPDPWPKNRHAERRLFSHALLRLINSRTVLDGELLIVTDHQPFANWIQKQAAATGFESTVTLIPPRFGTRYEEKWHRHGQDLFNEIRLVKKENIQIPLLKDEELIFHTVDGFDLDYFSPTSEHGLITVEFKKIEHSIEGSSATIRTVVVEGNLIQYVSIKVVHQDQRWLVCLNPGQHVVPTVGVQRALDLVRDACRESMRPS